MRTRSPKARLYRWLAFSSGSDRISSLRLGLPTANVIGRFDAQIHFHDRLYSVAAEDPSQRRYVRIVAPNRNSDMTTVNGASMRRIESAPAGARHPCFEPSVTGLRCRIWSTVGRRWREVARDIARGDSGKT